MGKTASSYWSVPGSRYLHYKWSFNEHTNVIITDARNITIISIIESDKITLYESNPNTLLMSLHYFGLQLPSMEIRKQESKLNITGTKHLPNIISNILETISIFTIYYLFPENQSELNILFHMQLYFWDLGCLNIIVEYTYIPSNFVSIHVISNNMICWYQVKLEDAPILAVMVYIIRL